MVDSKIKITHVNDRYLNNGGAEIFLRELYPHLRDVTIRQSICVRPDRIDQDFASTFPFPVIAGGRQEIQQAIDADDVIICWGNNQLNKLVDRKPKVCIYNACADARQQLLGCNEIVTHVIASNSLICKTVAFDFPHTRILPGVNPDRLITTESRDETRRLLNYTKNDFVVAMIARIDFEKQQDWLVQCRRQLPPHVKALFVGDGPDRAKLEEVADENCRFVGHQKAVGNWFNCIDAYCLLSSTEGCPAAMFEAMFAKVPIIATPVGSVPDLIEHGKNGMVVTNHKELVVAINTLADNPEYGKSLANEAYQTAIANGHIKETASQWESLIKKLKKRGTWKLYK